MNCTNCKYSGWNMAPNTPSAMICRRYPPQGARDTHTDTAGRSNQLRAALSNRHGFGLLL